MGFRVSVLFGVKDLLSRPQFWIKSDIWLCKIEDQNCRLGGCWGWRGWGMSLEGGQQTVELWGTCQPGENGIVHARCWSALPSYKG